MWTFISVSLAMLINENNYQRIGFPYQYFEGNILMDKEVHDLHIPGVFTSLPLAPSAFR